MCQIRAYTGNIAEWEWMHKDPAAPGAATANTYAFTYDKLSRLTDSRLFEGTSNQAVNDFTERGLTYDRNGNFRTLKRYGANNSLVDSIVIAPENYRGNQIISARNNSVSYTYDYDLNGNMTEDGLNALKLGYNFLNLTSEVRDLSDNVLAEYRWLADGTKVGVKDGAGTQGLEYIGSLIYKRVNGELQLEGTSFGGGRIEVSESVDGNIYTPNYYLTDHLGSTRAIYDGTPDVVRSNFTPFGTRWNDAQATTSRYQFTGYEDQSLLDNKYMDAGARFRSTGALPIFTQPDPLMEDYKPFGQYLYCLNNPIRYIDPNGMDVWEIDTYGNIIRQIKDETQDAFHMVEQINGKWQRLEGEQYSISFEYGTVKNVIETSIKMEDGEYKVTMFQIKGDDNGQKLFEIMSNNPNNVEWSHTKVGIEGSGNNFVGTSHTPNADASYAYLPNNGYTIREHTHNHPGLARPSENDRFFSEKLGKPTYIYRNDGTNEPTYLKYNSNGFVLDYKIKYTNGVPDGGSFIFRERMTPWQKRIH